MNSYEVFSSEAAKIVCPARILLIGASGSGKTQFVFDLLNNAEKLLTNVPDKVLWFYGVMQEEYKEFANTTKVKVRFYPGFDSSLYASLDSSKHTVLVVDDMIFEGKFGQV